MARIVVVDNASTDGTREAIAARWPHVHLIALERNVGFAAANNVALRESDAELVLLLNSDTETPRGSIDTLVDRLDATGAVAAGPRLVGRDGRPEVSFGRMLSPWSEMWQRTRVRLSAGRGRVAAWYIARLISRERFVDWVSGACLLVRRRAAVDAGLFDERYFMYEEDVDFCAALRAKGGRILFTPRATVVHARGQSVRAVNADLRAIYDRSHRLFYEKHRPGWVRLLGWWQSR
jgi:GT2 family glycosyltransferase